MIFYKLLDVPSFKNTANMNVLYLQRTVFFPYAIIIYKHESVPVVMKNSIQKEQNIGLG